MLERIYCKQQNKQSLIFADLASSETQKGSIKATIDLGTQQISHSFIIILHVLL